jgi:hypothetical protein
VGNGFNIHIGATGCPGGSPTAPPSGPCANPNISEVTLMGFTPGQDTIVADVGSVLADVDVTTNTGGTAPGCLSAETDPECETIFANLGLPFAPNPAGAQSFLSVP